MNKDNSLCKISMKNALTFVSNITFKKENFFKFKKLNYF